MIKKIIAMSALFVGSLSSAFAGSFYVGPMIAYRSITANSSSIHYQGIGLQPSVGYGGFVWEYLYLAGELFISPKTVTIRDTTDQIASLKISYNY